MGVILVYDVTDEHSFKSKLQTNSQHPFLSLVSTQIIWIDIKFWMQNIDNHASAHVHKVLVANKVDLVEKRKVIKHVQ